MKCAMCSVNSFGYTFGNGNLLCFFCVNKIKEGALDIYAPNPFQEVAR